MHIPDGFIAPQLYAPAYAAAAGCWAVALRRMRRRLREETVPYLAVLTGAAFVLMTITVPLPGGTSVHATGVALLAVFFGPWIAFVCISIVLLMQALLLGMGGVTALPVNALAIGLAGGWTAASVYRALHRWRPTAALFLAGWLSVLVASVLVALALGVQPQLAHDARGEPLFFPFGLGITLPALVLPHLVAGVAEGALTVMVYRLLARIGWRATAQPEA